MGTTAPNSSCFLSRRPCASLHGDPILLLPLVTPHTPRSQVYLKERSVIRNVGLKGRQREGGTAWSVSYDKTDRDRQVGHVGVGEYRFLHLVEAVRITFPLCKKCMFLRRRPQGVQSWLNVGVGEGRQWSEAVSLAADLGERPDSFRRGRVIEPPVRQVK